MCETCSIHLSDIVIWEELKFVDPKEEERVLGTGSVATYVLDSSSKASYVMICGWIEVVVMHLLGRG